MAVARAQAAAGFADMAHVPRQAHGAAADVGLLQRQHIVVLQQLLLCQFRVAMPQVVALPLQDSWALAVPAESVRYAWGVQVCQGSSAARR